MELCQCEKLQELDLKDTEVERLPRELASLRSLVYLSLDRCKLKPSLEDTYSGGVVSVHKKLNRKDDRKLYKVSEDFKNVAKDVQQAKWVDLPLRAEIRNPKSPEWCILCTQRCKHWYVAQAV